MFTRLTNLSGYQITRVSDGNSGWHSRTWPIIHTLKRATLDRHANLRVDPAGFLLASMAASKPKVLPKWIRGFVIGAITLGALTLSSCSFEPNGATVPTRTELVGTWVHEKHSSVELSDSGKVTFVDVPRELLAGTDHGSSAHHGDWTDLVSSNGTWSGSTSQGGAYPVVHFSTPEGASTL